MNAPARPPILQVQGLSFAYPGQPALASDWSASFSAGVTLLQAVVGYGFSKMRR